ncbi:hypothetical protein FQR65_LT01637 [Abscondita terminalis]|nr:hypothetical protein FQR65_LT01637 [Abscondita terminalis]
MPTTADISIYSSSQIIPVDKRNSSAPLPVNPKYAVNRLSLKYESCNELQYGNDHSRTRFSLIGEGSGDSSTTTSGSSCGERDDGSDGKTESDELERYQEERIPLGGVITELERLQVETFFKGLKTQVYVSSSLANLYTKSCTDKEWQLKYVGIPLILLDVGEARSRNRRKIQIVLAEQGSCFMLWRDTIDNLSAYEVSGKGFHTMCYSGDHTLQIGFSFDSSRAAQEMWTEIEKLVACPENISLSIPGKKKKKEKKVSKPVQLPSKSHISQPCCFQHVTSVDQDDRSRYYSLKEFVPISAFTGMDLSSMPE